MKKHRAGSGIILLLILVWLLIPLIVTIIYSLFQNWTGIIPRGFSLKAYAEIFSDPAFLSALGRTILICIIPILNPAGFAGAFCDRAVFPRSGTGCADHLYDSLHDSGRHSFGQYSVYVRGK